MARSTLKLVFVGLAIFLSAVTNAADGDVALGEQAYVSKGCMGCHGPGGNSPNPAVFPTTAGLESTYIEEQLKAFRSGARSNPLMSPMSQSLSDEDITNLAVYLASQ